MSGSTASPTAGKWRRCFPKASPRHADFARRGSVVVGDVHPAVAEVAGALTPVPGGVGPLTIALLLAEHRDGRRGEGRMVRLALTGGIATGKSTVLRLLQARQVPTIDADVLAREVVVAGSPGLARRRRALRRRRARRATARSTVGPWPPWSSRIRRRVATSSRSCIPRLRRHPRLARGPARATPLAVADIPLLFETGHQGDFDRVARRGLSARRAGASSDGARRRVRGRGARAAGRAVADRRQGRAAPTMSSGRPGRRAETERQVDELVSRLTRTAD